MTLGHAWVKTLMCLFGVLLLGTAQASEPVNLIAQQAYFKDATGQLTLAEVKQKTFTPYEGILSKGYSKEVFWIRLRLDPTRAADPAVQATQNRQSLFRPRSKPADEWVLRIRPAYLDDITLYDPLEPERGSRVTGDRHAWLASEFRSMNHGFVMPAADKPRDVWLRLQTTSTMLVGLDVYTYDDMQGLERRQEIINSVDIVLLMFLILWGVSLCISRPDKVVVAFSLMMLLSFFYATNYLGYYRIFFGDYLPVAFSDRAHSVLVMIVPAAHTLFNRRLLAEYQPKAWMMRLLLPVQYYFILGFLLYFLGYVGLALQLNLTILTVSFAWICAILLFGIDQQKNASQDYPLIPLKVIMAYYFALLIVYGILTLPALNLMAPWPVSLGRSMVHSVIAFGTLAAIVLVRGRLREQQRQRALAVANEVATLEKNKRLEQDQFFAMLTHEIRTPLTVMTYATQTALPDEQLRDHVKHGISEIDQIIERCVQADRVGQDDTPLEVGRCKAIDLVHDTLKRFPDQRIELSLTVDPNQPLRTDASLFQVVFGNLVDNALKYSPAESMVAVHVSHASRQDQAGLVFSVSNWVGPSGVPDAQKLFDKYYRASRSRNITGSGLGLYVARAFATKIGGELTHTTPNNQIVFELWMPTYMS